MEYHYPAEFIVPTNIPFDIGPLGYTVETEFEHQEVPVGLQLQHMKLGFLVMGGNKASRFNTNFRIVYEAAMAEINYLIITTNKEWRHLLPLFENVKLFRLGSDLTLNILDPEGIELSEYANIITQTFAQVLHLSRAGVESLMQSLIAVLTSPHQPVIEDLIAHLENKSYEPRSLANREIGTVFQFLQNLQLGEAGKVMAGTIIPFEQLMQGVTVLEINLETEQQIQFFQLCILAKILAYSITHQTQKTMVLIDNADLLVLLDPQYYKVREIEIYLRDWFQQLKGNNIGIHLSLATPSRFPSFILNTFETLLAHQIISYQDIRVVRDLLQFLPDRMVHSTQRHDNYQIEYLKTLPSNRLIMKRIDIANAFPMDVPKFEFSVSQLWDSEAIQARIRAHFSDWSHPVQIAHTLLEQDFGTQISLVIEIIYILASYAKLGKQALLSALNADPAIDLGMIELERLLHKMVQNNYLVATEWVDAHNHRYTSYQLTEKGRQAYNDYLNDGEHRNE